MINREVIYERNLTGSYMKIPASYDAAFDEKMMLRKKLDGLLPVEKCYVDGSGQYWYNISGRQSLDTFCKVKSLGIDFIERMIVSICSQIEILEWNLLNADSLLLDPEFIFITNSNQEVIFTIYPGAKESISKEFQQLMEFLLTKIDHKDAQAVQMAYSIYEKTLDEGYNIMDIRNLIMENKNTVSKAKPQPVNAVSRHEAIEERRSNTEDRTTASSMWGKTRKMLFEEEKPADYAHEEDPYGKIKGIWNEWKERIKQNRKRFAGTKRNERSERAEKYDRNDRRFEVVYPTDTYIDEQAELQKCTNKPKTTVNPTICLSDYREHPEGLLLYEGLENFDNICLEKEDVRIGQGEDVDIVIAKKTISHFHAQVEYKDNEYYLEDLNSTNGTYVNDMALSYKEKRKLCCNDIIRFADVKYRFI